MEILSTIGGLISLGNSLMAKFPDYQQKIERDWNKCVLQYENYKVLPREKRVSSYLFKLKAEIEHHLISAKDYIK